MIPAVPIELSPRVKLGHYCDVGRNVEVVCLEDGDLLRIGDCARIADGVRFVLGRDGAAFGDYLTLHEGTLVLARGRIDAGHNTWVGRNSLLDGTGRLELGDGVRIGAGSQIWTHAEAGEELEGCRFNCALATVIGDGSWLVGRVDVNPGVRIAERAVVANGAVVTRSLMDPWSLYAGNPARKMPVQAWTRPTLDDQFKTMLGWAVEFAKGHDCTLHASPNSLTLTWKVDECEVNHVHVRTHIDRLRLGGNATLIDLSTRRYTKRLSTLEVMFLRWLDGRRARFVPVQEDPCAT